MGRHSPQSNKITLEKFMTELDKRGLCERRKNKYRILLRKFSKFRLSKLSMKEIEKFFLLLKNSAYSDETKVDYWCMFKIFLKWQSPKINLSDFRLKVRFKAKLPKEILSLDEIRKLIPSYENVKFRTMVALLYDSGCRPEELLRLEHKDVEFDSDGLVVKLDGKTGPRRIRLITTMDSDKFLREYMSISNIPEGKIFGRVCVERLNQIVKEQAKKIGITKRVYTYIFRHSRATHLAQHMTDSQMKVYFGWTMDSKMPAIYIHLSGRDIDNKVMELNHNPVAFMPSESFKEFMFEMYQKWKVSESFHPSEKHIVCCS